MRRLLTIVLLWVSFASFAAETGGVVKVLPFLLDKKGRIARSPSLFDRDAYQVFLREHTNDVSGMRFDVLWKAENATADQLKLRVEVRGAGADSLPKSKILEAEIPPGKSGNWTQIKFTGVDYKQFGSITSWQTTLWSGTNVVGEQQSFLW